MISEVNIKEILALYERNGTKDYIGESISQIEHASQCAQLAMQNGADTELIAAAYLHDIGHLVEWDKSFSMDGFGNKAHDLLGADYLQNLGFSHRVCHLVKGHVAAKRYLVSTNVEYKNQLSEASLKTLSFQGGAMTASEVVAFEKDENFAEHIALRKWDDLAKKECIPLLKQEVVQRILGNC